MKLNRSKLLSSVIACACMALTAKPSLAGQHLASPSTISFKDDRCRVPELAPFKLQTSGLPSDASSTFWWYLVFNFNVVAQHGAGQRIGACLRVGKLTGTKDEQKIAKAITCDTVGAVRVRRGVATFNGGYIECDAINIGTAGKEIGIDVLGSTKFARRFWVAFKGNMQNTVTNTVPLLRYKPATSGTDFPGTITFNLTPTTAAQPEGFVSSSDAFGNIQGSGLTIAVSPTLGFTGLFEAIPVHGDPSKLIYGWSLFGLGLVDAMPVDASFTPVGIGDSKLYIGGLPKGERFLGTLDFVVFDPVGGGRGGG